METSTNQVKGLILLEVVEGLQKFINQEENWVNRNNCKSRTLLTPSNPHVKGGLKKGLLVKRLQHFQLF